MDEHNIKSRNEDFETDSYWLDFKAKLPNVLPVDKLESEYIEDIVSAILNEFIHTSDKMKSKFETLLEEWLIEMNDSEIQMDEDRQVQTLIYEMF